MPPDLSCRVVGKRQPVPDKRRIIARFFGHGGSAFCFGGSRRELTARGIFATKIRIETGVAAVNTRCAEVCRSSPIARQQLISKKGRNIDTLHGHQSGHARECRANPVTLIGRRSPAARRRLSQARPLHTGVRSRAWQRSEYVTSANAGACRYRSSSSPSPARAVFVVLVKGRQPFQQCRNDCDGR